MSERSCFSEAFLKEKKELEEAIALKEHQASILTSEIYNLKSKKEELLKTLDHQVLTLRGAKC